jgi:pilus assembly protein CpaB
LISLALGLVGGLVAFAAIKKKEAEVRRGWKTVEVVVAKQDVAEGALITLEMIASRQIPEQFVTSSVVKPDSVSYVLNQKVLVPLQAGDMLLWTQFETTRVSERLSSRVQRQARAVTIEVSQKSSVGGWIRPNDHVDVIGTFRDPQNGENAAMTVLQNVVVLATGKLTAASSATFASENQRDYSNVTLLVVPEEAEILAFAAELGTLSLSLRNQEDTEVSEERDRTNLETLISGERAKAHHDKRQRLFQMITRSGERSPPVADHPP